jgi:hypothetical protein
MKRTEMAVEAANEMALRNERTKLDRVTLPAAYRALAKDCLKQKRHLDCAPELVEHLRSVVAELKLLTDSAKSGSPDQIWVNKAKSAASSPNDKLGVKRDRLLAKIGQAIYGLRGSESGPADVVAPIQDVFTRLAEIDSDLARVSQPTKGAWIKIQRLIIGCGIVAMLVFCVLIATLLIGARAVRQSLEAEAIARKEEAAKDAAAAIALYEPAFLQMLKDGDAAWESGEKGDAVQHYTQLLAKFCGHGQQERTAVAKLHLPEMARAAGRSIDFLADSDIDETAKQLIKKAEQSDLVIAYTSAKANRLVKEVKADQAKEDRKREDRQQRNLELEGGSELSANRNQAKGVSRTSNSKSSGNRSHDGVVNDERSAALIERLGTPDEKYYAKKKKNLVLAVWHTGNDQYTIVTYMEAVDGSNNILLMTRHDNKPRSIVEQMKRKIDTF